MAVGGFVIKSQCTIHGEKGIDCAIVSEPGRGTVAICAECARAVVAIWARYGRIHDMHLAEAGEVVEVAPKEPA